MKGMTAVLAYTVCKIGLVDLRAYAATNFLADGAANDATDESTEQATYCTACRARDHANGGSGRGTLHGAGYTCCRTGCAAYSLTNTLGETLLTNVEGLAEGTLMRHENS